MRDEGLFNNTTYSLSFHFPRQMVVGMILVVALFAFEIFNFDTTQYALVNLLGDVSFAGLRWATILAIAFCAIDFAGLAHLFTPERDQEESREVWYLMGAWLLGATMNALMTWWAVSLTLMNHDLGNEVLSREQLLRGAPIFVAALVWLTRILFIGSISVAGAHLFQGNAADEPVAARPSRRPAQAARPSMAPAQLVRTRRTTDEVPGFLKGGQTQRAPAMAAASAEPVVEPIREPVTMPQHSRVRQRPPGPAARRAPVPMGARSHRN